MENIIINNNDDNNLGMVNRGQRRVQMIKITNESKLQVTFSKRRFGLFKKASELCTLCGVEILLVVFSPGRNVFSFGHPSVEALLERYAKDRHLLFDRLDGTGSGSYSGTVAGEGDSGNGVVGNGALQLIEAYRKANLEGLYVQLEQVMEQLDTEKKRGDEMTRLRNSNQAERWWERPIEMLDMEQLEQLKMSLVELKKVVQKQAERIMIQASNAVNNAGPPPIPYTPAPQQLQFYPVMSVGSEQQGESSSMMVSYDNNNMNNGGFGSNGVVQYSGTVNNNHGGMMMNMPPPPLPPSPEPQQGPHGYNSIGYGGRLGFY